MCLVECSCCCSKSKKDVFSFLYFTQSIYQLVLYIDYMRKLCAHATKADFCVTIFPIKLKKSLGCDLNRNRVKWFAADRSQFICYFWAFIQSKHKIIRRSLKTNENYMLLIWAKLLIEINLKMK